MFQYQKVLKEINSRLAGLSDGRYSIGLGVKKGNYHINSIEHVRNSKTPDVRTLAIYPCESNEVIIFLHSWY